MLASTTGRIDFDCRSLHVRGQGSGLEEARDLPPHHLHVAQGLISFPSLVISDTDFPQDTHCVQLLKQLSFRFSMIKKN